MVIEGERALATGKNKTKTKNKNKALQGHGAEKRTPMQAQLPSGWRNLGNPLALSGLKVPVSNTRLMPSDFQNHFEICEYLLRVPD